MPQQHVLFQTLFEHSPDGVLLTHPSGEILRANPSACRALQMDEDEIRRRGRLGIVVPTPRAEEYLAERARSGVVQGEVLFRRSNGSTFPVEFVSAIIPTAGSERQTYVIFRDISERRRMEEEIRERARELALHRRQLLEALEGSDLLHWDWDLRTNRTTYSSAWPLSLGYGPDEIESSYSAWAKLVHADDVARVNADVVSHLKGASAVIDTEYRMRTRDGGWKWIHSRAKAAEWSEDGRALRVAGTHADVTRRREAEDLLRAALARNETLVAELTSALQRVKTLTGLLPICAWCKKVRSDEGYWQQIEHYITQRSDATFTHAMCPECFEKTGGF